MLDAAMFKASGGFRPRWLPHYLSDYEFTLRLQRKGVRLAVEPGFCAQTDLSLTGMGQPTATGVVAFWRRSEEHTSELQSLMRISYAVFCLKKKKRNEDKKAIRR